MRQIKKKYQYEIQVLSSWYNLERRLIMSTRLLLRTALLRRSGGRCECAMKVCDHHASGSRCPRLLRANWQVHRRAAGGDYALGNTIAMCPECHRNTYTYGR